MTPVTRRRLLPRVPRLPGRGRLWALAPRVIAVGLCLAAVLAGAFFWVRRSSLVAVQRVTVTGVSGPDASAISSALVQRAEQMTTLDVDLRGLRASVARFSVVRGLRVSAHLPHALTIAVAEEIPVAILQAGGADTTISSQGTLLRSVSTTGEALPIIRSARPVAPSDTTVTGVARTEVMVLAAAPYRLRARIATAGESAGRGLTVGLRNGPSIHFGGASDLPRKWQAAIAVLASPTSAGASYIDVSDPARPAAGTGSDATVG